MHRPVHLFLPCPIAGYPDSIHPLSRPYTPRAGTEKSTAFGANPRIAKTRGIDDQREESTAIRAPDLTDIRYVLTTRPPAQRPCEQIDQNTQSIPQYTSNRQKRPPIQIAGIQCWPPIAIEQNPLVLNPSLIPGLSHLGRRMPRCRIENQRCTPRDRCGIG